MCLVLSIRTVHKYFSWCREELPAPLLQRNGSLVLLSRPALLLSAFSVSLGMEEGGVGKGPVCVGGTVQEEVGSV